MKRHRIVGALTGSFRLRFLMGLAVWFLAIRVGIGANCYVWISSPSEAAPYDTWETACHDLQTAIDFASTNVATYGTVVVTNWTFSLTNIAIQINTNITVRSVNGAADTIIQRSFSALATNVLNINAPGAVVDGFTLRNGNNGACVVGSGTIRNCIIGSSTSPNGGGSGLILVNGTAEDCVIYNNSARGGGGARLTGTGVLRRCTIYGNFSSSGGNGDGGGVLMTGNGLMEGCIVTNNSAGAGAGGGVSISAGIMRNCLIAGNSGGSGGGVRIAGSTSVTVQNCTIVNNTTTGSGGGIYTTLSGGVIQNCIVYNNRVTPAENDYNNVYKTAGTFSYSCSVPLISGGSDIGNIAADPFFDAPASANYRLAVGSPCIDAGTAIAAVTNDLDGVARPQDGDGNMVAVHDIGAYEALDFTNGVLRCGFIAPEVWAIDSLEAVFTATVAGSNRTGLAYYWDFETNGVYEQSGSDKTVVTNTYGPGAYSVLLVVSNAVNEGASRLRSGYVYVAPSSIKVSTAGSHTFPYDTWAKAATNLQMGIDVGTVTGTVASTIWVSNGVYKVNSPIVVSNGITVQSVNGAGSVVVTRDTNATALLSLNFANAVVDGFSFTNGYSGALGGCVVVNAGTLRNSQVINNPGVGVQLTGGIMESCLVSSNRSRFRAGVYITGVSTVRWSTITKNWGDYGDASGSGIGIALDANALVENCLIVSNYSGNTGTCGGQGVYMTAGTLRSCLIFGNYCTGVGPLGGGVRMTGGIIESCTIANNSLQSGVGSGAGVYATAGAITNCIVYFNTGTGGTNEDVRTNDIGRFWYSCAPELTNSENYNVTGDPMFVDAAGGNYQLLPSSAALDGALLLDWMQGPLAVDLAGKRRIRNLGPDMGPYESQPLPGTILKVR